MGWNMMALAIVQAAPISLAPFVGTWTIDTAQDRLEGTIDRRTIRAGSYRCGTCQTEVSAPTDGRFHSFAGGQDFDAVAVRVLNPRAVEFRYRKNGRLAETITERVSADGLTMTYRAVDLTAPNGRPVVVNGRRERIEPAPVGAHAASGGWRSLAGSTMSAAALTMTIRAEGDSITLVQPTGRRVTARLGGAPGSVVGDQAGRRMAFTVAGPNALRTVTTIGDKVERTGLLTVAPAAGTLTYQVRDEQIRQTMTFVARKR